MPLVATGDTTERYRYLLHIYKLVRGEDSGLSIHPSIRGEHFIRLLLSTQLVILNTAI